MSGATATGKGNVVIAGDRVYAGIDESGEDRANLRFSMVVEFGSMEDLAAALRAGSASFTVFETDGE